MECPVCKSENNRVIDTRKYPSVIFRVRYCEHCHARFKTEELTFEFDLPAQIVPISTQIPK